MTSSTSTAIRREFLEFFAARGHRSVPSAPVFPKDDPTLLFTNAGMNQFKDVFLGTGRRDYTRAVDTQKCIRVSGKHNDLEQVGRDTYHHTFFEMLGNWSFGDYFKQEAIGWAWELLTRQWKLPQERLWVTVFAGDEKEGLAADEEAARLWRETTDIDPSHVLSFGKQENFWEMGETGPCGPCSEIHFDRGPGNPRDGGDRAIGVNAGNERFIELWNLVFMEFNRLNDGRLERLPARHVDTGMGFERLVAVMQQKRSNYDTDVFSPIFATICAVTGRDYRGSDSDVDVAFRVIADHVRAVTSAFADGALPSNVGRGYVLRRLIRRASRWGRQALGQEDPFLWRIVPAVTETLSEVFPEIPRRMEHVETLLRAEEEAFGKTLGRGLVRFEELVRATKHNEDLIRRARPHEPWEGLIPGKDAFELYATYGFPRDLIEVMAGEHSLSIDQAGWDRAYEAHQATSRSEGKFKQLLSPEELGIVSNSIVTNMAVGGVGGFIEGIDPRDAHAIATSASTEVRGVLIPRSERERQRTLQGATFHPDSSEDLQFRTFERLDTLIVECFPDEERSRLVLRATPFYPESGGQVGDTGSVRSLDGTFSFVVEDTKRESDVIVHLGTSSGIARPGMPVVAEVDIQRRDLTRKNHTATHLLHKALKTVLGEHATQQGSYVGPDRLRFDFTHPRAVTPEELEHIEALVNERIFDNADVKTTIEDLDATKRRGVVAMFGEKYDAKVRVLDVGGWSLELCGGTHVRSAGDIGPFVIVSESAIQAGVRRIEALTGPEAVQFVQRQRRTLQAAQRALKSSPDEILERIEDLQKKLKEARKEAAKQSRADLEQIFERAKSALQPADGIELAVVDTELDQEALRELAGRMKSLHPHLAVLLLGRAQGKVPWIVWVQGDALARGLDARNVAAFLRARLKGGGGGKKELGQGQGQDADAVSDALEILRSTFLAVLKGAASGGASSAAPPRVDRP